MICFVIALPCEAKPIIKYLKLKQDQNIKQWSVYKRDRFLLIVSGVGKIASAMATTYILGCNRAFDLLVMVNIGVCGAKGQGQFHIGDMTVIHQIRDHHSRKTYYPDLIISHAFMESSLETFDYPVVSENSQAPLVDMEASGFFQASSLFIPLDNILCLKVVSDYLGGKPDLHSHSIASLIESQVKHIADLSEILWHTSSAKYYSVLTEGDERLLSIMYKKLLLTHAQKYKLRQVAESFCICHQCELPLCLVPFIQGRNISSKRDIKQYFNKIITYLLGQSSEAIFSFESENEAQREEEY